MNDEEFVREIDFYVDDLRDYFVDLAFVIKDASENPEKIRAMQEMWHEFEDQFWQISNAIVSHYRTIGDKKDETEVEQEGC